MGQGKEASCLEAGSKVQILQQKPPHSFICLLCTLLQFVLPKHRSHDSRCLKTAGTHPSGEYMQHFVSHHVLLPVHAQNFYGTRGRLIFSVLILEDMVPSPH